MQILLAEDSTVTRRLVEATLRQDGHDVTAVGDGVAAWNAFQQGGHPLVILDWRMPELDGLEVCRRIRASEAGRDTFILMLTARDGHEDLLLALGAGADDYLTKPATVDHMRARLAIAARRIEQNGIRRAAEDGLAQARWLAGVGETALALQHEINNPLTALLTHAQLLDGDASIGAEHRAAAASIVEQARRIAAVVRRLASLDDPQTVNYLAGARMLDLRPRSTS